MSLKYLAFRASILAFLSFGQTAENGIPKINLELLPKSLLDADTLIAKATISIPEGWHIYSHKPLDGMRKPCRARIVSDGIQSLDAKFPDPEIDYNPVLKRSSSIFHGKISVEVPFVRVPTESIQSVNANLEHARFVLYYQACGNGMCLNPDSAVGFVAPKSMGNHLAAVPSRKIDCEPPKRGMQLASLGAKDDISCSPSKISNSSAGILGKSGKGTDFSKGGIALIFALMLGGLALNLTPCVYPMLAITVSIFGGKSSSFLVRLFHSSLYVMGIMVSFSALGVFAALSGNLFGSFLQSSMAQLMIVGLFVILAMSSFGFYEIRMPFGIMGKATSASNFGGLVGAISKGLFAGLLAAPCIGPFVLALLVYVSEKGDVFTGLWMFSILAFGMGIPYIILGTFTGLLKSLPRSGEWMVDVKKILGVVLLLLALYYGRGFLDAEIYNAAFGLLVLYIAIYINPFSAKPGLGRGLDSLIRTAAAVMLLFGASMIFKELLGGAPVSEKNGASQSAVHLDWKPYDSVKVEKSSGQWTLVDFQSKVWCAACREMEDKTFSNPEVGALLRNSRLLSVDVDNHPQAEALQKRFGIRGIPTVVILDPAGQEVDRLIGFVPPKEFAAKLESLKGRDSKALTYSVD
jgi:thioredoxin:protein disulfide reductase